jgi:hypothetical protein
MGHSASGDFRVKKIPHLLMTKKYNDIAACLAGKLNKTDILALILSLIVKDCGVQNDQYMIIASYCLKDFRDVGDLDVIITTDGYAKLKKAKIGKVATAKISGDERIMLSFPEIDDEAEIEFFPKKCDEGFPSTKFSICNVRKEGRLVYDHYNNPYYNIDTCIDQYADIVMINDKYYLGDYETNTKRIVKNISHLQKILDNIEDMGIRKKIVDKIQYLSGLINTGSINTGSINTGESSPMGLPDIAFMDYPTMKKTALQNKKLHHLIKERLCLEAKEARTMLGKIAEKYSDQALMERIYHLNDYVTGDARGIIVNKNRWAKNNNEIIDEPGTGTEKWLLGGVLHRKDGPALIDSNSFCE